MDVVHRDATATDAETIARLHVDPWRTIDRDLVEACEALRSGENAP